MKKHSLKIYFVIAISMVLLLTGCSNSTEGNYDNIIIENAKNATLTKSGFDFNNNPFLIEGFYFNVKEDKNNEEFIVDVNGTEMIVQVPINETSSEHYSNPKSLSEKSEKVVNESKELVFNYIDSSSILKDKDNIKNYINSLDIKEADFEEIFDDGAGACFYYKDNAIYINQKYSEMISEWMCVHEFIHAICYYTHNLNIENETYANSIFNETMTDIITSALNPNLKAGIKSSYSNYYNFIYPYINLFGETAIEAYFYGYDEIYKEIGEDKFNFFILVTII